MTPELERALYALWRAARKVDPALTDTALEEPGLSVALAVDAVEAILSTRPPDVGPFSVRRSYSPPRALGPFRVEPALPANGPVIGATMLPLGKNTKTVSPPSYRCGLNQKVSEVLDAGTDATGLSLYGLLELRRLVDDHAHCPHCRT